MQMESIQDIFTWARIKGSILYGPSQAATLLAAVGGDEDTTIPEFAAMPTDRFFAAIEANWLHAESSEMEDMKSTDIAVKPSEMTLAKAVSAHHVARLWNGVDIAGREISPDPA